MPTLTNEEVEHRFNYHAPDEKKAKDHAFIRHSCIKLADTFNLTCPVSSETLKAIEKIEEAMFWANAAIARHEK